MPIKKALQSTAIRNDFVEDFTEMMMQSNIPLEKTKKMIPFLSKHCKQGGTIPSTTVLRRDYVPKVYEKQLQSLWDNLKDKLVTLIADETTDCRDHSILNVIAVVHEQSYLINVVTLNKCNHHTFSKGIIDSVSDIGIESKNVRFIVTDAAAYCKKRL